MRKHWYHTLHLNKRFIMSSQEKQEVRETLHFTAHMSLQLVLTLPGTSVNNIYLTRITMFTRSTHGLTTLKDCMFFPERSLRQKLPSHFSSSPSLSISTCQSALNTRLLLFLHTKPPSFPKNLGSLPLQRPQSPGTFSPRPSHLHFCSHTW